MFNHVNRGKLLILALLSLVLFFQQSMVFAEGSANLYPNPPVGVRANLEWRTNSYGPAASRLIRRTILYAYAQAGETILMGSTAVGVGAGNIQVFNPGALTGPIGEEVIPGVADFSCEAQRTASGLATQGQILSRANELAGPDGVTLPAGTGNGTVVNGYLPCHYQAPTTGLYAIVMYGPAGANSAADGNPTRQIDIGTAATLPANYDATQGTSITAWDITVRGDIANAATNRTGRVYANYLALFTRANGAPVTSTYYAVTLDGFVYETNTRGFDPNGYLVYGNESGFLNTDGTPLYRSVMANAGGANMSTLVGGVSMERAQFPIFFNVPDNTALDGTNALGITTTPVAPIASNFTFTGTVAANTSLIGTGGTFGLTSNVDGRYELVVSRDGVDFDPTNPLNRVLRGPAITGVNNVNWNGLDNSGNPFPVGIGYSVRASVRAGEYHFPMLDAENSINGGPQFRVINPPTACPAITGGCSGAFYDDRGYFTAAGTLVGTAENGPLCAVQPGLSPAPLSSDPFLGYNTLTNPNQRAFGAATGGNTNVQCTGNFGDMKGLDMWTYYPSNTAFVDLNIVDQVADLELQKSLSPAVVSIGDTITYTITLVNRGPDTATTVSVTDPLPAGLVFVGATPSVGNFAAGLWDGFDLANGATATLQIQAQVPAAGTFVNTAQVAGSGTFDIDSTPGNNNPAEDDQASVTFTVAPPPGGTGGGTGGGAGAGTGGTGGQVLGVSAVDPALGLVDPFVTKSVTPPFALPGEAATWTITIFNPGATVHTNIVVNDTMPQEVAIRSVTTTAGTASFSGQVVTLTKATLSPGESVTITVNTVVRDNAAVPFIAVNKACLTTDQNPTPTCASATLLSVGSLPQTGQSPWSGLRLLLVSLVTGLVLALFIKQLESTYRLE